MRVRILAYYHDLIGKLLAEGQKPTSIHRCLLAEGAQVSRSAIKQYIAKYPSFPASGDLYLQGCQRVMVPSTPSSAPQVGLPSAPAAKKSKRALAPYLTKLVQTEVPAHTEATRTLGGISSPLWQAKKSGGLICATRVGARSLSLRAENGLIPERPRILRTPDCMLI
jgi:hypothetical protein